VIVFKPFFIIKVQMTYNGIEVLCLHILSWQFCTSLRAPHGKWVSPPVMLLCYYHIIDCIPYTVLSVSMHYLFYNWKSIPLNPLYLFHSFCPSNHQFALCIFVCSPVLCFRFYIYMKSYGICLSLTHLT